MKFKTAWELKQFLQGVPDECLITHVTLTRITGESLELWFHEPDSPTTYRFEVTQEA